MIELLIVITIIGIAATITWSSLAHSRNVKKVSNACESALVLANKTRAYALAGQIGIKKVSLDCTTAKCSIQMTDINDHVTTASGDTLNTSAMQGVAMNPNGGHLTILYTTPYGESSAGTSTITFTLPGTNPLITKTLTIDKFTALCK